MSFLTSSCLSVFADASFSRLFRTVYPNGLDEYATPGHTPTSSRTGSIHSVRYSAAQPAPQARPSGFLARWGFVSSTAPPTLGTKNNPSSGAIEELILSGAAFGELLIAGVPCSLFVTQCGRWIEAMGCSTSCFPFFLPKSGKGYPLESGFLTSSIYLRTVVGLLGYNHDRQLALRALAVSAARSDVHSVFAGCVFLGAHSFMVGYLTGIRLFPLWIQGWS